MANQIPRYEPYPALLPVQTNDDGCFLSCLKGFCDLIQKICQVALAVFNHIFCCEDCDEEEPPKIQAFLPRKPEPVHPQGFPHIFKPNDFPLFKPAEQPVVQPEPGGELDRAHLVRQYYESMLEDEDLKALLAASGNAQEMEIIEEALKQRKAEGYVVVNPPEPHRIVDPVLLPNEPVEPVPVFGLKRAPTIPTDPVVPAAKPLSPIQIRPLAPPAVKDDGATQPCPVAPLRMAGKAGDGTPLQAVLQFIKDEIANDGNWELNLSTFNEINVPVAYRNRMGLRRIHENCDRLTQENWIEILNEIPHTNLPEPVIPLTGYWDGNTLLLEEGEIKRGFQPDREIVMKQRLAVLAKIWVDAKTPTYRGRVRDESLEHPFHLIYDDIGAKQENGYSKVEIISYCANGHAAQAEETLLAMQELIRYLPLIRAFAAEKKEILVQYPGLQERRFNVNYLLDSVLSISTKLTGLIIHNTSGPSQFKKSESNTYKKVLFKELDSDKIATAADTLWNAYLKAKAHQDLSAFLQSFGGICFDARIRSLNDYIEKFAVNREFILNPEKLKKDYVTRVAEYYEVFLHEQMAVYCERQEPKLKYEEFKQKIEQERASDAAKQDPVNIDFFKNYATQDRFKAWAIQVDKDNRDVSGRSMFPLITNYQAWNNRDVLWGETLAALNDLAFDFEP